MVHFDMIKAILFDLDGTLVQMPDAVFKKQLFDGFMKIGESQGFDSKEFLNGVLKGYMAMQDNQSDKTNEQVFLDVFPYKVDPKVFDDFYRGEFNQIKNSIVLPLDLKDIFKQLKAKGLKLCIATAPMFPISSIEMRLGWVGLTASDFDFITSYDTTNRNKKHTEYYTQILKRLDVKAHEALMVGNNTDEDLVAAKVGCPVILLTDQLLNPNNIDINQYPNMPAQRFFDNILKFVE